MYSLSQTYDLQEEFKGSRRRVRDPRLKELVEPDIWEEM